MQRIIIYGSEYGTTRRYAEQLSRLTGLPATDYAAAGDLHGYERVVYLGGLYAGGVKGLKRTVKRLPAGVKLILVTVGLADVTDQENIRNIQNAVRRQLPPALFANTALFHLRGGIDYSRLNPLHKTMMTLLYNKARRLPEEKKTAETRAMVETFDQKVDFVDFDSLRPVVEAIGQTLQEARHSTHEHRDRT